MQQKCRRMPLLLWNAIRGRIGLMVTLFLPLLTLSYSSGAQSPCTVQLMPDLAISSEDNTALINVTANDNLCTNNYVILPISQPANGSVTIANGNSFNFTPTQNFSGCTSFQYAINSNPEPTTANNDAAATLINAPVMVFILNNDTDPQNDPLTPTLGVLPTNGTAVLNANKSVTYTPNTGFSGSDQFSYTINDGNGNTSAATVKIDVRASNPGTLHYVPPKYLGSTHANYATQLWINTENPGGATGTITKPGGVVTPFTITSSGTFILPLSAGLGQTNNAIGAYNGLNTITTDGLIVQANVPVNVQVIQENANGQSALTSKSEVSLGTSFYAGQMGLINAYEAGGISMISVIATENGTTITINRPPGATWNWQGTGSGTVNVTLNAGQSYMVGVISATFDMTGSTVTSNKPISMACGSFGAAFTNGGGAVDNGWDQMVPVGKVGSSYVIINSNSSPDVTDFVATQNGTTVTVNGVAAATINAGQYYRLNLTSDNVIGTTRKVTTSAPVYAFLNTGRDPNRGENGLALVAPINSSGRGTFRFRTPNPSSAVAPIALLTNTSSISSLKVFDVTGGGNTLVINGPAGTPVATDPTLSTFLANLQISREYKVTCNAFVQLSVIGASTAGGAISYFGGFEPSNTVASNDNITVVQNVSRTFSPLNNDVDGNGDPLTITNVSTPAHGTATFNAANGTITYTPVTNYNGSDVFSYTITDGNFNFSTAQINVSVVPLAVSTVTIEVSPVADNPQIAAADGGAQIPAPAPVAITIGGSPDTDGSETLGNVVTVSNVPATLTFSAGTNNNNGTYTIPVASLPGLTATSTTAGAFALTASINNTDAINCNVDGNPANSSVTTAFSDPFTLTFTCPVVTFSAVATGEVCPGATNGTITISGAAGGFAPYAYSIDNGATYSSSGFFTGLLPGVYQVTIRDANGCESNVQNVTVSSGVDNTPPGIACPAPVAVDCPAAVPAPNTADVVTSDNCSAVTVTHVGDVISNQSCASRYTITRTYMAMDAASNSSTCTQTITVDDQTGPAITCPANVAIACTGDNSPAATGSATALDNCSGAAAVTYTDNVIPGNCPGNYVIARTWTSSDACGNSNSCIQTITVQDQTGPVIACPANITVSCNAGDSPSLTGTATATDDCSGTTDVAYADQVTFGNCPGNYVISRSWSASDACGNSSSCTQTITVQDQTAPVISCPANVTIACTAGNLPGTTGTATATDNCGTATVTSSDMTTAGNCPGNYSIARTWTATDACGNSSSCTQTITVQDQTAPVITCPVNVTIACTASNLPAATGTATATDNCGTTTVAYSDITTAGNCPGNYTIARKWTATDACGNSSNCTQTITVTDQTAPVITCPVNVTIACTASNLPAATGTATATDNCGTATVTSSDVTTAGNCPGNYTIARKWTATDACGNSSNCTQTITVKDLTAPTAICKPVTVYLTGNAATVTAAQVNNGSSDNCSGIASMSVSPSSFTCANRGANTVTLTVTDACGNASTCTATVTVVDNTAPVISCSAPVVACNNGTNTKTLTLTASDNCGLTTVTYAITGATPGTGSGTSITKNFSLGTSTVVWTVKDASNNTSTCTTTVTINALPVATINVTSSPNDFCNRVTLSASSSMSPVTGYAWYYNGTPIAGATMSTISLGLADGDGSYTVKVTNQAGCQSAASAAYNFQKQNIAAMYVLIGFDDVDLDENNDVYNGSVGVLDCNGDADFKKYCSVASPGAFVKADDIDVQNPVNIPNRIYSPASVTLPTMLLNTSNTSSLSNYTMNSNGTLNNNYKDLVIKENKVVTLNGTIFRKITIEENAKVTFTGTDIRIETLETEEDVEIHFANNANIRVSKRVDLDKENNINPGGKKVTFYMGDGNCDEEKFVIDGRSTNMIANVYMPNGKLRVHGNGYSCNWNSNEVCNMTGLFIAEHIHSDGRNVNWYSYNCGASSMARQAPPETSSIVDEISANAVLVYPNPTNGQFTIQFSHLEEAAVVQIMDIAGKVVEQRVVEAGAGLSATFDLSGKRAGAYIVNVKQGSELYRTKLILQ